MRVTVAGAHLPGRHCALRDRGSELRGQAAHQRQGLGSQLQKKQEHLFRSLPGTEWTGRVTGYPYTLELHFESRSARSTSLSGLAGFRDDDGFIHSAGVTADVRSSLVLTFLNSEGKVWTWRGEFEDGRTLRGRFHEAFNTPRQDFVTLSRGLTECFPTKAKPSRCLTRG